MSKDVFQSLWIGHRLSMMELLSIQSFLHFGYEYHLYCYEEIENVPSGVTVRDGREILPADEIFFYRRGFGKGSPACFSDMFRYKMLLEKGQWWVDTDVVCVQPFDFQGDHVLGNQRELRGESLNNAVIKAPAGSPLAAFCYDACLRIDRKKTRWGETGPRLMQKAIDTLGMSDAVQPPTAFYPIDYWKMEGFFENGQLPAETRGVHLWQAMWKSGGIDPEGRFPPKCLYEQLRRRFLTDYIPPNLSERPYQPIAEDLANAAASPKPKPPKKPRRGMRSILPWKKAG